MLLVRQQEKQLACKNLLEKSQRFSLGDQPLFESTLVNKNKSSKAVRDGVLEAVALPRGSSRPANGVLGLGLDLAK